MKKIDLIQSLRGIAAMLVVLYHCRTMLNTTGFNYGSFLFDSGSIGVDLFFMISGFIMVYTTYQKENEKGPAIQFIFKRIIRIVPLYWICTILFMWVSKDLNWFNSSEHLKWLSNPLFFIPMDLHAAPPFFGYAPMFTGWTLNYEMFFYLIFGVSLFFKKFRWHFLFSTFFVLLILIPVLNHNFNLYPFAKREFEIPALNFLTNPMMFDFVFGIGMAFLYFSSYRIKNELVLKILPLLAIAFFLFQYFTGINGGHGVAKFGLSCELLLLSFLFYIKERTLKIPKWMVFLGDISYSLYITHILVLAIIEKILAYFGITNFWEQPLYFIPTIAIVILFSYTTYLLIEQKLSSILRRIFVK